MPLQPFAPADPAVPVVPAVPARATTEPPITVTVLELRARMPYALIPVPSGVPESTVEFCTVTVEARTRTPVGSCPEPPLTMTLSSRTPPDALLMSTPEVVVPAAPSPALSVRLRRVTGVVVP
jgi:hypothetical protein